MNERRLRIYLDDHLAIMVAEVALIGRCWWSNRRLPLGEFLQQLENEVQAHKAIAQDVIHRMGGKKSVEGRVKQGAAWFAEKLGRFKLNDSLLAYSDLSRVLELEALGAAAQERIALWDNLDALVNHEPRLEGITFLHFREQSKQHLEELQIEKTIRSRRGICWWQAQRPVLLRMRALSRQCYSPALRSGGMDKECLLSTTNSPFTRLCRPCVIFIATRVR